MWRFVLATFGFLGFAFYQASDGGDYAPRANSLQAHAALADIRPMPRPLRVNVLQLAGADAAAQAAAATRPRPVTALSDLRIAPAQGGAAGAGATLAPAAPAAPADGLAVLGLPDGAAPADYADLPADLRAAVERASLANLAPRRAVAAPAHAPDDIRRVTGDRVSLRGGPGTAFGRIAQLPRGTEVVVLGQPGNGWLRLRVPGTGRTGWLPARLVGPAGN